MVKNLLANAGDRDTGCIPGLGRHPGGGNGSPLQYSCLKNPIDRGAWQATVHGVAKSRTRASIHTHISITNTSKATNSPRGYSVSVTTMSFTCEVSGMTPDK